MRTQVLGRAVHIHTDHCPICGLLRKSVNNWRIERVTNLIQEYQIAEMKHNGGKSKCLAGFLPRPFDDPLFNIFTVLKVTFHHRPPPTHSLLFVANLEVHHKEVFDSYELQGEQAQDADIRHIINEMNNNRTVKSHLLFFSIIKNNLLHKIICHDQNAPSGDAG